MSKLNHKLSLLVLFLLTLILLLAWGFYTQNININIAYMGFSPFEWLIIADSLDLVSNAYPSGIATYKSSFFMYIYKLAYFLKIDLIIMMKTIIAIELVITWISIYVFLRVLLYEIEIEKRNIVFMVLGLYFIASYALFPEISRFGSSFSTGLYYNVADSLRLLAIALFLRRKYIFSGIILSAALITHPIYGVIGAIFILTLLMVNIKSLKQKDYFSIALAILLFLSVFVFWYIKTFIDAEVIKELKVPQAEWYFWAVFGNFHWFPIEFGLLDVAHKERLIGFLSISLLYLYTLSSKEKITIIDKQLFYGWLVMVLLTIIGLFISWYKPSPFLTKLALTRASLLAIEISIFYVVYRLIDNAFSKQEHILVRLISLGLLVSPFFTKAPFPLYLVIILVIWSTWKSKYKDRIFYKISVFLVIFLVGLVSYFYFSGLLNIEIHRIGLNNYLANSENDRYLGNAQIFFILLVFGMLLYTFKRNTPKYLLMGIVLFMCLIGSINYLYKTIPHQGYINKATSYKQLQVWSSENTPSDSLFMIDPSMSYGWRAYSQRASFGVLREWTQFAWLYSSDYELYKEGMKRFNEFGIDIQSERYQIQPRLKHFKNLRKDIREKYYLFEEPWFKYMSKKYGINYLVMNKEFIKHHLSFKVIYENKHFLLYEIPHFEQISDIL